MLAVVVIMIMTTLSAWFGWQRQLRRGLISAILLPAIISLTAAFTIRLPTDVGGPWIFVLSFVVLAGASLLSFGVALWIRRLMFRN